MVDTVFFQTIPESPLVLRTESGGLGKPRIPVVPKNEVVIKRKANPEMMKRIINFLFEIFIQKVYQIYDLCNLVGLPKSTLKKES